MRVTPRQCVAFFLFLLLALVASSLFFMACVPLFDPLGGASGNLARENPPSLLMRVGMAAPFFVGSIVAFVLAAIAAKSAVSKDA